MDKIKVLIDETKAIKLIKTLLPFLSHFEIKIDHIGEFRQDGLKHLESICNIQFNNTFQIIIWNEGVQCYDSSKNLNDQVINCSSKAFEAYKLLLKWGVLSNQ